MSNPKDFIVLLLNVWSHGTLKKNREFFLGKALSSFTLGTELEWIWSTLVASLTINTCPHFNLSNCSVGFLSNIYLDYCSLFAIFYFFQAIQVLISIIRKMVEDDGVNVFYVRGNHDHEIDKETVKILFGDKVNQHFYSYTKSL